MLDLESLVGEVVAECWGFDIKLIVKLLRDTEQGAYGSYDLPTIVGKREEKDITIFAIVIERGVDDEGLARIRQASREARKLSGHYDEYFG